MQQSWICQPKLGILDLISFNIHHSLKEDIRIAKITSIYSTFWKKWILRCHCGKIIWRAYIYRIKNQSMIRELKTMFLLRNYTIMAKILVKWRVNGKGGSYTQISRFWEKTNSKVSYRIRLVCTYGKSFFLCLLLVVNINF